MIGIDAVVRALHIGALMALFGNLVFLATIAGPALRYTPAALGAAVARRSRRLAAAALALALVSGALWLVLTASGMSGQPLAGLIGSGVIATVLTRTSFGRAWGVDIGLCLLLTVILMVQARREGRLHLCLPVAAAALGSTAWLGHAAASGTLVHPLNQTAHLLAAGAWFGALFPLLALLWPVASGHDPAGETLAGTAAQRFSTLGIVSVAILSAAGLVNAFFLVGRVSALVDTAYGRTLLVKLALFALILGLAATNRFTLAPRLSRADQGRNAARWLRRTVLAEIVLGTAVILVAGFLASEEPAIHAGHVMPAPGDAPHHH